MKGPGANAVYGLALAGQGLAADAGFGVGLGAATRPTTCTTAGLGCFEGFDLAVVGRQLARLGHRFGGVHAAHLAVEHGLFLNGQGLVADIALDIGGLGDAHRVGDYFAADPAAHIDRTGTDRAGDIGALADRHRAALDIAFDGAVGFRHSCAEITFTANLEKKTADVRTRFQIQPGDILGLQAFIDRKHLEQAKFRAPLAGKLQARYDEDWVLRKAVFNIRAEQLEILKVPLASLQASGTYEPGFLEVPEISAQLKPGEVTGSFRQDLETGDYRFLLEGNLFPSQLNPWFRPWWDNLWGKFQFTGLPLQANIDVSGRWKDLSRRDIFGSGEISSASYKGAPFERVQGQLRCIPKYTELFDLNAKFPDGHARGRLAWTLHPEERSHVTSRRFNLRGKLNLETAGKLFGSKVEKVLADFTVEETPDVVAEGVLFGKGPFDFLEKPPLNDFTVQSQTGKAAFLSIPLDFLQIDLHNLGHAITIDPLHFGFAGGKAEGWLKHRHNPEGPPMEFSIHLKDADKHLAIQNLSQNPKLNLKPSKPPKKKATFQSFQIHATGDHGDLSSFEGSGSFALRDPGLAQINMLGLFSKELKRFTLPLISYSFDRMEAKFKLRKQFMVFDPQPLIVRGPTSKLDATGSFNIKTRELDFKIRLLQLGLLPLAGILEMNLGGTIDKPVWNPKVKPSETLDPFKPLNPKNGKSLPLKSKDQK